ncbi:NAD-dependent epimerase/dehydratase family protein [Bacillus sp. NPDC077027]|uniref:NAD-dependent epimerase/dehydratase family protein n=1 Tax=Bacillus sp. NPDC077027 TaxID=3390548 RepID=UPI003D058FBA
MKTLIIGSGMIGSHLGLVLIKNLSDVIIVDGNIDFDYINKIGLQDVQIIETYLDTPNKLDEIINMFNVDNIVVCAGALTPSLIIDPQRAITNESKLIGSLIRSKRLLKLKKLIYISSFAIYGNGKRDEEKEVFPKSNYGFVKLYNERLLIECIPEEILIILRPTGVIGPVSSRSGNWMSKYIREMFKEIPGNAEDFFQEREMIDVRDIANIIELFIATNNVAGIYNVGTGNVVSAKELLKSFIEVTENTGNTQLMNIMTDSENQGSIIKTNVEKLFKKIKYTPQYEIKDSLKYIQKMLTESD